MTEKEIQQKEEEYNLKMKNTKEVRAIIDSDFKKVLFKPEIKITSLADIIYYGINEREQTYFEDDEIQCEKGKRRTIEDTYRIQKSYNIKCRFKDIQLAVESLLASQLLTFVFCKKTLVNTYSRKGYNHELPDFSNHLNNNSLNHFVKEIVKKKILKKKLIK